MNNAFTSPDNHGQPFARGQGGPFVTGPFLGGYMYVLTANVAAGGVITITHTLRAKPRHVEVSGAIAGEYPSRVTMTVAGAAQVTVKFESAQSAGATVFLW